MLYAVHYVNKPGSAWPGRSRQVGSYSVPGREKSRLPACTRSGMHAAQTWGGGGGGEEITDHRGAPWNLVCPGVRPHGTPPGKQSRCREMVFAHLGRSRQAHASLGRSCNCRGRTGLNESEVGTSPARAEICFSCLCVACEGYYHVKLVDAE
ncbi:hypothetical protein LZ31DRAFT_268223 [Colletotrichum somersetense]|nr:hypothetical protein LZ31DRAFT_268223 [Colletotrichum somersetense]